MFYMCCMWIYVLLRSFEEAATTWPSGNKRTNMGDLSGMFRFNLIEFHSVNNYSDSIRTR